jgi:signal transduction histidine kinase
MTHELRTPLTGIIAYAELLAEGGCTPEETAEGLKSMK